MNSQNSVSIPAKKTAQQNYTANLPIETLGFPGLSLAALGFQVRRVWWLSRVALGLPVLLLLLLLRPDSKEAMAVRLQEVRLLVMAWEISWEDASADNNQNGTNTHSNPPCLNCWKSSSPMCLPLVLLTDDIQSCSTWYISNRDKIFWDVMPSRLMSVAVVARFGVLSRNWKRNFQKDLWSFRPNRCASCDQAGAVRSGPLKLRIRT